MYLLVVLFMLKKKKKAFGENRQFQLITRMLTREPVLQQTSYLGYNVRLMQILPFACSCKS